MTEANDRLVILLKEVFGWKEFRPVQKQVIDSVYQGEDTLAILPTGGGKSLCYQLPALISDGCAIVVSPLIALMKNQVDQLQSRGINAMFLNSSLSKSEIKHVKSELLKGKVKLLYVAPESMTKQENIDFLNKINIFRDLKYIFIPKFLITCPHCAQSSTVNHNISSGTSSCSKCKKKEERNKKKDRNFKTTTLCSFFLLYFLFWACRW